MTEHLSADLLIDYLHGELTPDADARVHVHLAACDACRAELDRETRLTEVLRAAAARDELAFPPEILARVRQAVRTPARSPLGTLLALWRPLVALPAAAIVLAAIWLASPLGHPAGPAPTIDAFYFFEQHAADEARAPFAERNVAPTILETAFDDSADGSPATMPGILAVAAGPFNVAR